MKSNPAEIACVMKRKLLQYHQEHDLQNVIFTQHLLANITLNDQEVNAVNESTMEQWKCKEWYSQKAGIITASKVKTMPS